MKQILLGIGIIGVIASALFFGFAGKNAGKNAGKKDIVKLSGNAYQATMFSAASTTGVSTITSSTRILATTTSETTRVYAHICNDSSTKIYLNMNADKKASLTDGFPLAANTCFDINDQNLYQGSIQASSTNETSVSVSATSYEL